MAKMMQKKLLNERPLVIATDGGARGNPGPAAIAAVLGDKRYGEYIGRATNNAAEYRAVIFGLKKAIALLGKKTAKSTTIEVRLDSELVARQLNGVYRVKEKDLVPLFVEVWNLKQDFQEVFFTHVPREENQAADRIVNAVLDKNQI